MQTERFIINTPEESKSLARLIAAKLKPNSTLLLKGEMGSGKTFFCQEIIRFFCGEGTNVTSPTFNILQIYQAPDRQIYHFDLYRLKHPDEAYEVGLEDALGRYLCLIEWPDIVSHMIPHEAIILSIKIMPDSSREATLEIKQTVKTS